ncbi:helix-turn-helix domain-containing protein [Hymenobacter negativus]|uniref:AraC family transcriptional regulator n=1 Tax=Hymenobacter negativus TaxID=2795026 RepID=A0ABS3QNH7_9BACT|nr:AraC family transcriptional regulator [Hymenobacter negativus]MBO2012752.1 AraC family transcriptional regulator [Hymenobacter negativus]
MHFQQLAPPEPLREYVQYFWALECAEPSPTSFRTIADGCPGLVFQQTVGGIHDPAGKPWPTLLLHGQATKASEAQVGGAFQMVGACFHPSAVPAVFDVRADELTDSCLDMALLPTPFQHLTEQLQHRPTTAAQLELLAAFLLNTTARPAQPTDPSVQHALTRLLATQGRVSLRELQQETQLSERSLQRKFQHRVGVPPKLFARICQFQATLRQLRTASYDKLSDLAFTHEYADQSHHIRGFKEFAGLSPRQYLHRSRELMENLTEPR